MANQVKYILPAETINMGGIFVKQALPTMKVDRVDPFLLLHHGNFRFNADAPAKQQGIGPHPHRGFSPVTFVIEGEIRHQDSRGNDQVAKAGEVQWMHAGAGIIHSERPTENIVQNNRNQEVIQLWINSPASEKMKQPDYQFVSEDNMERWVEGEVAHKLIAGKYEERTGTITPKSELLVIWSTFEGEGETEYKVPEGFNVMVYIIRGKARIGGHGQVDPESLVIFNDGTDSISVQAQAGAQVLLLSGRPLNEKVAQHGPFVMNNQTEILEAMRDYQMGKMGVLIEE